MGTLHFVYVRHCRDIAHLQEDSDVVLLLHKLLGRLPVVECDLRFHDGEDNLSERESDSDAIEDDLGGKSITLWAPTKSWKKVKHS